MLVNINLPENNNQKGIIHLFLLLSSLAIIVFLGISYFTPLKDQLFSVLNRKTDSFAAENSMEVKVLQLKYFPVDSSGENIDRAVVGPSYPASTLTQIREMSTQWDQDNVQTLTEGSKFRGYKNPSALPALQYNIIENKEYLTAAPLSQNRVPWSNPQSPTYRFDFMKILGDINICDYVDNRGVRQVWYQAYHYGPAEPYESNMAMGRKSRAYWNFATYGNISNSERINDMPVCENTYVLIGISPHTMGHQIEATLDWVDTNLFRKLDYPFGEADPTVNRCGTVHEPPNTKKAYQYNSEENRKSDCEDWKLDGGGEVKDINCHTWYGATCSGHEGQDKEYLKWWMQNIPGLNNGLTSQGRELRNWWEFIGDFDIAVAKGKFLATPRQLVFETVVSDNFNRANSKTSLGNATTGQSWITSGTVWGVSSNTAYSVTKCRNGGGPALIDSGYNDGSLEVKVPVSGYNYYIPFRYSDNNNYALINFQKNFGLELNYVKGGMTYFSTHNPTISPQDGDTIRIEMVGSEVRIFVNGIEKGIGFISGLSGTKHGIQAACDTPTRFDDFLFQKISSASPLPSSSPAQSPSPSPTATPAPFKKLFVTSATYNGNLGGVAGADSKCQTAAAAGGLTGNYKAWISGKTQSAASRLTHSTLPYKLINGATVANSWDDFAGASHLNKINITELGTTITGQVWTNSTRTGATEGTAINGHCNDWSVNASGNKGNAGSADFATARWTNDTRVTCNTQLRLYCLEQ